MWDRRRDPLYRGDVVAGVQLPSPDADPSIVRHVLYLHGPGRRTPYLSTTERREVAERFAGKTGRVYSTRVSAWRPRAVVHIDRKELLDLLRGRGKGDAKWPSAYEVMKARHYVEENAEHLADFRALSATDEPSLRNTVDTLFDGA